MKYILLLCGLLINPPISMAVDIRIGGVSVSIPSPEGYDLITEDMKPYATVAKQFVPPTNEQYALFLPKSDVAAAARGEMPRSKGWFAVQTGKTLIEPVATPADFQEGKKIIKTTNDEIFKKVSSQMPDFYQKLSDNISEDYKIDWGLEVGSMIPLPIHHETDRSLAYSVYLNANLNEEGKSSKLELAQTNTIVFVKGKMLFLFATTDKAGLEWSRTESQKWADAILAENPNNMDTATSDVPPSTFTFRWNSLLGTTTAGAIIGGVIGMVVYVFKKLKG